MDGSALPTQLQLAWRLLNPAAGEHLSQLELSQNGQAVIPSFQEKDAAGLTGPSALLTLKQLRVILASLDLKVCCWPCAHAAIEVARNEYW